MLFKNARKTENLSVLRCKLSQKVIFCVQFFSSKSCSLKIYFLQIRALQKNFSLKTMLLKNLLFFKIWRVVKILIQNLTRWEIFDSKSDAL